MVLEDRLAALETEFVAVEEQLADPAASSDPGRLRELSIRHKELGEIVLTWRDLRQARDDLETAKEMLDETSGEDREVMRAELSAAESAIAELTAALQALLLPKDPNDGRNVIVEIRGAEGGEEANLFARDLQEMYLRYADRVGLKAEVLSADPSPMGGVNEVTFLVKGPDAWARLKHEGGPHRVQRVPVTESQGRVHTSSATVTVLPQARELDVVIEDKDLRVD